MLIVRWMPINSVSLFPVCFYGATWWYVCSSVPTDINLCYLFSHYLFLPIFQLQCVVIGDPYYTCVCRLAAPVQVALEVWARYQILNDIIHIASVFRSSYLDTHTLDNRKFNKQTLDIDNTVTYHSL